MVIENYDFENEFQFQYQGYAGGGESVNVGSHKPT
jgi:hypothetical protein